VAGYIRSHIKF